MNFKQKPVSFYLLVVSLALNLLIIISAVVLLVNKSIALRQNAQAAGVFRYVSPTGSDAFPGTQNQPWKTLKKAAATAVPGDTITILPGTYFEKLTPVSSGTAGNYITYKATPSTAILDGKGVSLSSDSNGDGLVQIVGKSYIKIQGLTIKNSVQNGVNIRADAGGTQSKYIEISGLNILDSTQTGIKAKSAQYLTVKNNVVKNVKYSSGIGIWSSDQVVVDRNTIVNAHIESEANGGHEESLSVASTTNFEVSNNDVSMSGQVGNLGNEGIDIKEASRNGKVHHNFIHDFQGQGGALYVDAWRAVSPSLSNIEIYSNYLKNTANGINIGSEQGGTAENINVYNNLVYNTGSVGIGIPGRTGDGLRRNVNIFNNTIYKAQYNGGAGIYITSANISNIAIRNNIVYFNNTNGEITAATRAMLANIKADHNLVYGSKSCSVTYPNCVEISNNPSGFAGIYGNMTADPRFVNPTIANFHLQASSPAINKGVDLRPVVTGDYEATIRPQGSAFDMGAFEYLASVTPTATPNPTNIPTPTPTVSQPTAIPTPLPTSTPTTDKLLNNSSFEESNSPWYAPWSLDASNGTVATLNRDTTTYIGGSVSARVNVNVTGTDWHTQFLQDSLSVSAGKTYLISFWAKAQTPKSVHVVIQKVGSPYTQYFNQTINLTTAWQKYSLVFNSTVSDSNAKLTFFLGNYTGSTWFDDFSFTTGNLLTNSSFEGTLSPWHLDASNGTVATLTRDTASGADGSVSARVNITSAGTDWYTQFFQDSLTITAGQSYTISFWAKAQSAKSVPVVIQKIGSPYTQYLNQSVNLTSSWQKFNLSFKPGVSDNNVKLTFFLGGNTGTTWFDGLYFGL